MSYERQFIAKEQSEAPYFLGIDVGGTNIKIGLLDDKGQTLAFEKIPTKEADGPEQAVERSSTTGRQLAAGCGIEDSEVLRVGWGVQDLWTCIADCY